MKGIAGTAGKIEIVRVKKSEDLLQFLTFPEQVYKNFKVWVEPVIADQLRFFSEKNPLWGYVSKTLLLAKKEGRIAGRISVFLNSHYIKFAKEKAAYFGFFESIRDQNVADLLFAEAQKEVIKKGMSILRGPINASTLYETGLLIQGFNEIPTTSTNFAPKYYSRLISKAGFHKAIDLNAFNINIPPSHFAEIKKAHTLAGSKMLEQRITLRPFRKGDFEEEVKSIEKIMNDAMVRSHHYQFVPIGLKEFLFFAEELKEFFDPELIWFIEYRGKPNGVCVVYPDVNVALQKFHGKIGIREWAEWLFLKRKIKKARLEFIALEPILQHKGLGFALVSTAISKLIEKGYTHLEYSWVIETNKKSNHLAKIFGGKLYKRYRIFEKRLKKRQFSGLNNFGLKR